MAVYQRSARRPRIRLVDRILWSWMSRYWSKVARGADLRPARATVTAWQRRRFRDHWSKLSQRSKPGRPCVPNEAITLIRKISSANARWLTAHRRRVAQARHRGREVNRGEVSGTPLQSAFAHVEGVPEEPPQRARIHRFLHRPHGGLQGALRASPRIRQGTGRLSKSSRPSRGIPLRGTCYGIAMRSLENHSSGALAAWASNKYSPPLGALGKIHTLSV